MADRRNPPGPTLALGPRLISLPGRAIERLGEERTCWIVLGFAIAAYAALALWLTRGTTFYVDEVGFFQTAHGFEPKALLSPANGHLLVIQRAIYLALFKLFGPSYIPFRIIEVAGMALAAALFFVFAKRRVGGAIALAPTLVLLFFGTSWEITLSPLGISNVYSVVAGLGALLALDRGDWRGDLGASALLVIAIGSYSFGLAFVAAAAVAVLLRPNRWRRAWIFLIPVALYVAWLLAKPLLETSFSGPQAFTFKFSNIPDVPSFIVQFVSAVAAAVTGLNYYFSTTASGLLPIPNVNDTTWGPPVAAIAVAALLIRLIRGNLQRSVLIGIALLIGLGTLLGLVASPPARTPEQARYMYPGAVAALVVAVEAARGIRFSHGALVALFGVTAVSLVANIARLREGGEWLRSYSASVRADMTAIELARHRVDPAFAPSSGFAFFTGLQAGQYLAAVDRFGSPAFTPAELKRQSEATRQSADYVLAAALDLKLTPLAAGETPGHCKRLRATGPAGVGFQAGAPGVVLRSAAPAKVAVGRFATGAGVPVGSLAPQRPAALVIPADRSSLPWKVTVTPAQRPVAACELSGSA
jgi:hypothetical protein